MAHDLSKMAIHTMTHKSWSLAQCVDEFTKAGVGGISVWRNVIEPIGIKEASSIVRKSGLKVPALVRGGFFPSKDSAKRDAAIIENKKCVDEAAAIGAEMVVLVCGAVPGMTLHDARKQIAEGIDKVLPHAKANNVKLAIEPLHPMYAGDRSAINRMKEAREICEQLKSPWLGIAADVYHIWWDPDLEKEIELSGKNATLFAFHVCDWKCDTADLLNDRGLMGEGVIDIKTIRSWVERAGFNGLNEVEIFSTKHWAKDQHQYLKEVIAAYKEHV
jgi:sugar phosphate isomerase/epimerase